MKIGSELEFSVRYCSFSCVSAVESARKGCHHSFTENAEIAQRNTPT